MKKVIDFGGGVFLPRTHQRSLKGGGIHEGSKGNGGFLS